MGWRTTRDRKENKWWFSFLMRISLSTEKTLFVRLSLLFIHQFMNHFDNHRHRLLEKRLRVLFDLHNSPSHGAYLSHRHSSAIVYRIAHSIGPWYRKKEFQKNKKRSWISILFPFSISVSISVCDRERRIKHFQRINAHRSEMNIFYLFI